MTDAHPPAWRWPITLLGLAVLLSACRAPTPCTDATDCPTQCVNGACVAAPDMARDAAPDMARDAALDMAAPDMSRDAAPDMTPDAALDMALDMARDAALDMAPDAALDMALDAAPDMAVDQAMPCVEEVDVRIDALDQSILRRGDVYVFDVNTADGAQIEVDAPYGAIQRNGNRFEWAPRGGSPGDLPLPWWSGAVELTVRTTANNCVTERHINARVHGDVLITDQATGALWVLGSGGRLLERWVVIPGGGISAIAVLPDRQELLVGVRAPNASGQHLIHRLNPAGEIINTLAPEDFATGAALLRAPAIGIAALSNGRIIASDGVDEAFVVWRRNGVLDSQIVAQGPIRALSRWNDLALINAGGLYTSAGAGLPRVIERGNFMINAFFEHQDPRSFLAITGAEWNMPLRYVDEEFVSLRPLDPGTDMRALTRFEGGGYLSYDSRNRRLRRHDDRVEVIEAAWGPDVRGISVGALIWLDRGPPIGE